MGMYTGLRFAGIVKPKFRKGFTIVAQEGRYDCHPNLFISQFAGISRSAFIPMGGLAYMPKSWGKWYLPIYDSQTGYWQFQCSLKNYEQTIEKWTHLIPYFLSDIIYLEKFYEEWIYSKKYEMVNGVIVLTDSEYILYHEDAVNPHTWGKDNEI